MGSTLLVLVLAMLTARWIRAGASTAPDLWWPMLIGTASLLAGRVWIRARRALWAVAWIGVGFVLVGLARIYIDHPGMPIPGMYYATFGGAACVGVASALDLWGPMVDGAGAKP